MVSQPRKSIEPFEPLDKRRPPSGRWVGPSIVAGGWGDGLSWWVRVGLPFSRASNTNKQPGQNLRSGFDPNRQVRAEPLIGYDHASRLGYPAKQRSSGAAKPARIGLD